jgi:hydroxymethylpyrimidine pyrophosphatase-like HAD family hydrolase
MNLGAGRRLLLASDLDGTFLEGAEADRRALQSLFAGEGETTLIFVSGRSLASIESLLRTDPLLPTPDYVIGDVGASVVRGARPAGHSPGAALLVLHRRRRDRRPPAR